GRPVAALARHAVARVGQGLVILGQAEAVGDVAGLAFAGHLRGDLDVIAAGVDRGDAAAALVEGDARSLDAQFALMAWRRAGGSVGGAIALEARRYGCGGGRVWRRRLGCRATGRRGGGRGSAEG